MSHRNHPQERTDKTCLNCGAHVTGRYCQDCGQENLEPKEKLGHVARHFFEDLTHFDGKFLSSVKYLLFKPGFLTEEYLKGRRARYLHPVRMYMFISAVFFLVLFSITSHIEGSDIFHGENGRPLDSAGVARVHEIRDSVKKAKHIQDSLAKAYGSRSDSNYLHVRNDAQHQGIEFNYEPDLPNTVREYDSIQKSRPPAKRDGFFRRYMSRRAIAAGEYQEKHRDTYQDKVIEKFFHSIPQMYFVSLPLFALLLWLLNIRRRKEYYYVTDVIFSIHFYCLSFLVLLVIAVINYYAYDTDLSNIMSISLFAVMPVYLYLAMLRFYKQGWFKTLLKCLILYNLSMIFIVFLVLVYILNSFLSLGA